MCKAICTRWRTPLRFRSSHDQIHLAYKLISTDSLHSSMSTSNTPASASQSASPAPEAARRHVLTAVERQRSQLERLLKDPSKPAYVPPPPKDKVIRPAREMMKNVQGSSAGAGSGEFHVYKASRRREYERLKMMEDEARQVGGHAVKVT